MNALIHVSRVLRNTFFVVRRKECSLTGGSEGLVLSAISLVRRHVILRGPDGGNH